jgi:hypothetical protein
LMRSPDVTRLAPVSMLGRPASLSDGDAGIESIESLALCIPGVFVDQEPSRSSSVSRAVRRRLWSRAMPHLPLP